MPKLIDADKLKEHYAWWDNEDKKIFDTIIDLQSEAVVRCKDCKWRNGLRCYHKRSSMDDLVGENDFCSWGERRKDADK